MIQKDMFFSIKRCTRNLKIDSKINIILLRKCLQNKKNYGIIHLRKELKWKEDKYILIMCNT